MKVVGGRSVCADQKSVTVLSPSIHCRQSPDGKEPGLMR